MASIYYIDGTTCDEDALLTEARALEVLCRVSYNADSERQWAGFRARLARVRNSLHGIDPSRYPAD
jgi:hypothetical protein